MAVPTRPVGGASIESAWGGVVHDTAVAQDIQFGTVTWTTSAGARSDAPPIVFPRPFAAPPVVFTSVPNGFQNYASGMAGIPSATGITVCIMTNSGAALTAVSVTVAWLAIGPRA